MIYVNEAAKRATADAKNNFYFLLLNSNHQMLKSRQKKND